MGLFDKFRRGLKKTTQLLKTDVRDLFRSEGRLVDDQFIEELFDMLVRTDMGV
ncbi:MAG: signal recognition particle-docking protein FtsY, partial [Planctomycetes bacterium]|nr:signal recognition particle-docking protein FtsY [Planctomycetota bacterium]